MSKEIKKVESLVGKQYQRTGKDSIITVISHDIERCSVIVEAPDGKNWTLSTTTLKDKRSWTPIEASKDVVVEQTPAVEESVSVLSITTSSDFNYESLKKLVNNKLGSNFIFKYNESKKEIIISKDGHNLIELFVKSRLNKIGVYTKSKVVEQYELNLDWNINESFNMTHYINIDCVELNNILDIIANA